MANMRFKQISQHIKIHIICRYNKQATNRLLKLHPRFNFIFRLFYFRISKIRIFKVCPLIKQQSAFFRHICHRKLRRLRFIIRIKFNFIFSFFPLQIIKILIIIFLFLSFIKQFHSDLQLPQLFEIKCRYLILLSQNLLCLLIYQRY